ncbi:MAG: DUF2400 family protein [Nitrososphaeria archaeon]
MLTRIDYNYLMYVLDEAYDRLKSTYLDSSVLGPVRLYSAENSVDKEFWALFCALIDFQMPVISVLNPMLRGFISWSEERGIKFIHLVHDEQLARNVLNNFQWISNKGVKKGFTHRFVKIDDLFTLFRVFKRIINEYGSLKAIVQNIYENSSHLEEPMEAVFSNLIKIFHEYGGRPPLIPIRLSSPLKRLNLFMRWMVRRYPDLGLWDFIDRKHLLISLDEGLRRVLSRAFRLQVNMNWIGVLEATRFLREINPEDPVKYDYLLSRISIMGFCAKDPSKSKCCLCPLVNVCKSSRFTPEPRVYALRGKEYDIFERFLKIYGSEFDSIKTEYPLGKYSADALLHKTNSEMYVAEVEEELNYAAIGQVLTYRYLYFTIHSKIAKPIIICSRSRKELKETCEKEQGIAVIEINLK